MTTTTTARRRAIRARVTQNNHGNYRGHVTGRESVALGDEAFVAKGWLLDMLAEGATLAPTSYFGAAELEEHEAGIARMSTYIRAAA